MDPILCSCSKLVVVVMQHVNGENSAVILWRIESFGFWVSDQV